MGSAKVPAICQFWRSLSLGLPEVKLFGLDFNVTLASAVLLSVVRYVVEFFMVEGFGWPKNEFITKNAASSIAALVHSVSLVPSLVVLFLSGKSYNPSEKWSNEDVWWQQTASALLQFCTGYMLYDSLLNIVWMTLRVRGSIEGDSLMFFVHHIITVLYMTSTRVLKAGHQSAMICMMFGEMTNPFHNVYLVLEAAQTLECCNGSLSQSSFRITTIVFAGLYVLIRAMVGPFVCLHMTWNLVVKGRRHIPWIAIIIWNVLIWGIMHGSIPWMKECWNMLAKEFSLSTIDGSGRSEL